MPWSPPPPGARVGTRAWQGSEAGWRLLCPELCLSSFPVRGHWHPVVSEIDPVESGLCSWPWAEPVWRIQSIYSQKLRDRRYYQNIMHINDTQSGCICHLLIIIAVTATMCWALAVGQVFICEPDMHLSTDPTTNLGAACCYPYFTDAESQVQR